MTTFEVEANEAVARLLLELGAALPRHTLGELLVVAYMQGRARESKSPVERDIAARALERMSAS